MAEAARRPSVSFAEYLELELSSPERHQLVGGRVYAMVGGTFTHGRICRNLIVGLSNRLRGGPCEPMTGETRVRVEAADLVTYPDAWVVCGPRESPPEDEHSTTNPTLVAEVLSPSTERFDRGRKRYAYFRLPSLHHYLLVEQDVARAEFWSRADDATWTVRAFGPGESLPLAALGIDLPVDELYERVAFEPGAGGSLPPTEEGGG